MAEPSRFDDAPDARSPLRVLLVEDEAVNRRVLLRLLERLDVRADSASDGVEAVAAVRARPYDVILMDLQMPEMDGASAARRIRELPGLAVRPWIVALTGDEDA